MILKTNTKLITTSLLCRNTSLTINKRFTGQDKVPTVARAISKQCIGAGCSSTRPLIPSSTPVTDTAPSSINNNNIQTSNTDQAPQAQVVPKVNNSFHDTLEKKKEQNAVTKPIDTITVQAENLILSQQASGSSSAPDEPDSGDTDYYKQASLAKDNKLSGITEALTTPLQGNSSSENLTSNMAGAISQIESHYFFTNKEPYKHPNFSDTDFQQHKENLSQSLDQITQQKQEQDEIAGGDTEQNLTPSKMLKTINNKSYSTPITQDSTPENFTKTQMVNELAKRQLVSLETNSSEKDAQYKPVNVILKDNSMYNINQGNSKLTDTGNAYYEQLKNNNATEQKTSDSIPMNNNTNANDLAIIAPPKVPENIIIETGKAKHLMIGSFDSNGDFRAVGYLTSKKSGMKISDEQYSSLEQKQEKILTSDFENFPTIKGQYYVKYDQPTNIPKEDVKIVKYSEEYLKTIEKKHIKFFQQTSEEHQLLPHREYSTTCGITKEQCLDICKEHDKVAEGIQKNPKIKDKHPQSAEKQKLDKQNKDKQQN